MIGALLGVTGKLKTVLDRLTSTRATALDNLDATISSRAPSSTALSTAQWTNTRAGYLDNLATAVPSTFIQSIQTGYNGTLTSTSTGEDVRYINVTISAVVVAKSVVLLHEFNDGSVLVRATARLTSTTNLRISTYQTVSTIQGRWTVVEFK